jgi:lipoprotein signal peptidase
MQFVCGTRSPEISIGAKSKGVVFGYAARSEMPRVVVVVVVVLLLLLLFFIVNPALSAWEDISSSAASSGL